MGTHYIFLACMLSLASMQALLSQFHIQLSVCFHFFYFELSELLNTLQPGFYNFLQHNPKLLKFLQNVFKSNFIHPSTVLHILINSMIINLTDFSQLIIQLRQVQNDGHNFRIIILFEFRCI